MGLILAIQSLIGSGNQKEKTMTQYVVNQSKQIAVEAETPEEAQKKVLNGEGTVISSNLGVQARPQQAQSGITAGLVRPT